MKSQSALASSTLCRAFPSSHGRPQKYAPLLRRGGGPAASPSQVESTADFCHGSSFWTHFSGGLNYQVVHHLFPGVCHCHYPQLAPIVMKTCKEFGVRYQVYETFWAALSGHIEHLRKVGAEVAIPSLANVG